MELNTVYLPLEEYNKLVVGLERANERTERIQHLVHMFLTAYDEAKDCFDLQRYMDVLVDGNFPDHKKEENK